MSTADDRGPSTDGGSGTAGVAVVRRAFEALARGDAQTMLADVDPDVEWTFLDPGQPAPEPSTCRGRMRLARLAENVREGLVLDEVVPYGDRVLVVTRIPGAGERRAWAAGDLGFHVVTVRGGRVVALRACRSRREAEQLASEGPLGR